MIDKTSASSRVAGYLQSRQGRRPMRVDTLLAKLEKESKRAGLRKVALSFAPGSDPEKNREIAKLFYNDPEAYRKKYPPPPSVQLRPKQASLVPPVVTQLALGILEKTGQESVQGGAGGHKEYIAPAAAIAGGTGLIASPGTRGRLLGYQRAYHGTGSTAAEAINQEGLRASQGGTGAARAHAMKNPQDPRVLRWAEQGRLKDLAGNKITVQDLMDSGFVNESRGKVHVTSNKPIAKAFSRYTTSGSLTKGTPSVVKMDLPMDLFDKLDPDPDMTRGKLLPKSVRKYVASRGAVDVDPKYIHGTAKHSRRAVARELMKKFPGYVAKHPGRFALGVGSVGTGVAGIGWGGKKILEKYREREGAQGES